MARAAKLNLRAFQQELATRLAAKTTAQVESSRLGIECHGERWLVRLSDAGEVIAVPPIEIEWEQRRQVATASGAQAASGATVASASP